MRPPDRQVEIAALDDATRELVAPTEVTGSRTLLLRGERAVAIVVSFDEYLSLRAGADFARYPERADELQRRIGELRSGNTVRWSGATAEEGTQPLFLAATVETDLATFSPDSRRAAEALLARIARDPIAGSPLPPPLTGWWAAADRLARVVYKIADSGRGIAVLGIYPEEAWG